MKRDNLNRRIIATVIAMVLCATATLALADSESSAVINSARNIHTAMELSNSIAVGTFVSVGIRKGSSFRAGELRFGAARLSFELLLLGNPPPNVDAQYTLETGNPKSTLLKAGEKYIFFLRVTAKAIQINYAIPYSETELAHVKAQIPNAAK